MNLDLVYETVINQRGWLVKNYGKLKNSNILVLAIQFIYWVTNLFGHLCLIKRVKIYLGAFIKQTNEHKRKRREGCRKRSRRAFEGKDLHVKGEECRRLRLRTKMRV